MKILILLVVGLVFLPLVSGSDVDTSTGERIAVFVGDSLTLGYASTGEIGFAGMVSADLGLNEHRFVTYHLADTLHEFNKIDALTPDIIVVELGIHAISECDHLPGRDAAVFAAWYNEVLWRATRYGATVCALNIPFPDHFGYQEKTAQYNGIIERASGHWGAILVDAYSVINSCGNVCLWSDGLHPNDAGHRALADEIIRACLGGAE